MYMIWGRGMRAVKHASWYTTAASHKEQVSQLMTLVLFYVWQDARI